MSEKLLQLLVKMTPEERAEVEAYALFVLVRRKLNQQDEDTDAISLEELMDLADSTESFSFLKGLDEKMKNNEE